MDIYLVLFCWGIIGWIVFVISTFYTWNEELLPHQRFQKFINKLNLFGKVITWIIAAPALIITYVLLGIISIIVFILYMLFVKKSDDKAVNTNGRN